MFKRSPLMCMRAGAESRRQFASASAASMWYLIAERSGATMRFMSSGLGSGSLDTHRDNASPRVLGSMRSLILVRLFAPTSETICTAISFIASQSSCTQYSAYPLAANETICDSSSYVLILFSIVHAPHGSSASHAARAARSETSFLSHTRPQRLHTFHGIPRKRTHECPLRFLFVTMKRIPTTSEDRGERRRSTQQLLDTTIHSTDHRRMDQSSLTCVDRTTERTLGTRCVISTQRVYDRNMIWQHNKCMLKSVKSPRKRRACCIKPGDLVTHVYYERMLGTAISVVDDMITVLWSVGPATQDGATGGNLVLRSGSGMISFTNSATVPTITQGDSFTSGGCFTIHAQSTTK